MAIEIVDLPIKNGDYPFKIVIFHNWISHNYGHGYEWNNWLFLWDKIVIFHSFLLTFTSGYQPIMSFW